MALSNQSRKPKTLSCNEVKGSLHAIFFPLSSPLGPCIKNYILDIIMVIGSSVGSVWMSWAETECVLSLYSTRSLAQKDYSHTQQELHGGKVSAILTRSLFLSPSPPYTYKYILTNNTFCSEKRRSNYYQEIIMSLNLTKQKIFPGRNKFWLKFKEKDIHRERWNTEEVERKFLTKIGNIRGEMIPI